MQRLSSRMLNNFGRLQRLEDYHTYALQPQNANVLDALGYQEMHLHLVVSVLGDSQARRRNILG